MRCLIALSALVLGAPPLILQAAEPANASSVKAFVGAKIFPVVGDPIESGVLVTEGDKIDRSLTLSTHKEKQVSRG